MKGSRISRRECADRFKRARRGRRVFDQVMSAAPPASAITPALIEAAKKEGKVVWYTSVDLKLSEKIAKSFEAKYPGIASARRAHRRRTLSFSASARNMPPTFTPWMSPIRRMPRISSIGKKGDMLAAYLPEDVAKVLSGRAQGCGRHFASFRVFLCDHRLQHQSGEKGRSAEKLCRPARSEMEGQDRQGASRL